MAGKSQIPFVCRIQSGGGGCVTRKAVVSDPTALLEAVREDLTEKGTLQHWQAAADALAKSLGEGRKEEAELILAKAFGWTGWFQLNRPSYLKPKLPPAPEQITQALRWLSDGPLQLSPQQLKVALAKKPQVYLLDPRASYEKALEVAPEQWRSAEAFRALLLKKPQVLDLTHNCLLTDPAERVINEDGEAVHCDGRCTLAKADGTGAGWCGGVSASAPVDLQEVQSMGVDFVDLDVMSRFLRDILRHQSRAWDPAVANAGELLAEALQLLRVERLWLPALERRYFAEVMGALRATDVPPACVALQQVESVSSTLLLYHGCRFRQIDGILRDGFDPTFAGEKGGKLFGPGIYFSDVAAKADNYVDVDADGHRCLMLAQVSLGKVFRAFCPMPRFQPDEADVDSVLGEEEKHGGALDHREYVIYRNARVLPRYLLWYRHMELCECNRCIPKLVLPQLRCLDEGEISSARALAKSGTESRTKNFANLSGMKDRDCSVRNTEQNIAIARLHHVRFADKTV
eukprot:g13222.t2